jgi:hypothetical protein
MDSAVPASRVLFVSFLSRQYSRSSTVINNTNNRDQIDFIQIPEGKIEGFKSLRRVTRNLVVGRDKLVIMSPSHILSFYGRINFKGTIVLDAGWSHTDSAIVRFGKGASMVTLFRSYVIDFLSFHSADIIFFESKLQTARSRKIFLLKKKRARLSYTGIDESAYNVPSRIPDELKCVNRQRQIILFRGSYNPESGLELISKISGESILSDITIIVATKNLPRGIQFSDNTIVISRFLDSGEIRYLYELADLTLGQFGQTRRQQISIPHKVFESAFFGKAYLTPPSNALRELFSKEEIFYEDTYNAGNIAKTIRTILQNEQSRLNIQKNFANCYARTLNSILISSRFMSEIENKDP